MFINTNDVDKMKRKTQALLSLAGAGPGDPELISIKALKAIQKADVVLYDSLVNPQVFNLAFENFDPYNQTKWIDSIDLAPDDFDSSVIYEWLNEQNQELDLLSPSNRREAKQPSKSRYPELIFVGKRKGHKSVKQEDINNLILDRLKAGQHVLRLKGGDPFIFARGVEELEIAKDNGYDYQVIPGLTSGLAVPVSRAISLTRRGQSDSVTLVTGHEIDELKLETWARILDSGSTLIVYMGLSNVVQILRGLKKNLNIDMPALAIHNGTLENEKVVTSNLQSLAQDMINHGIKSPAILIFGKYINPDLKINIANEISKIKPEEKLETVWTAH